MEATKTKMNMDGTIRAKVLQYKSDGNTLTEKRETLKKYAEGVYYTTDDDGYGNTIHGIVFEANGVFWWSRQALRPDELNAENIFCQKVMEKRRNFERDIMANAEAGQYINNLQIEVMRRLGHEVAALQAAHDEYIRQREERDRLQAEEAERRERERREAEERRKAEVLADGKEKLLKHESITVEQIELIAEAVGYKIHIRTIGFMREKVTEVVMLDNDRVQVFGYKLTSRNIDGTAKVMHELCDRLKAQAEEEAKQAAQATETPRISTETAETVNASAEGENAAERAENKPTAATIAANLQTAKGGICKGKVLHDCNLAAWDKFHKNHKDAILLFHHGGIYTAFQGEAARVAELCGVPCEINRHGAKVCQIDEAALDALVSQGLYLAIAELTEKPDYGLSAPQSVPEAVTPAAGTEKRTAGPQRLNSVVKFNLRTAPRTIKKILKVECVPRKRGKAFQEGGSTANSPP